MDDESGRLLSLDSARSPRYDFLLQPLDRYGNVVWKIRAFCSEGSDCPLHNFFLRETAGGALKATPSQKDASIFILFTAQEPTGIADLYADDEKHADCAEKVTSFASLPDDIDVASDESENRRRKQVVAGLGGMSLIAGIMGLLYGKYTQENVSPRIEEK